ncbi:CPBP family intramembrane glutamic endopeptidase [Psychroserpens luteolus]|uniref:CPBP family intramembrane glutamic endopeptidase n=1 Tax=Psychroserpens luteolus TaxID=2855840 RepID=UPI001E516394|nr:CPBP family intramembrane glutamic endopeptidase [Psychroserpens luteolus]MCD2259077.1 CPBP family intramembrane metalloprotease [Psychroserpens luteolus]
MNYLQQAYKGENEAWKVILTVLIVSGLFIFNLIFLIFFGDGFDVIEEQKKMLELVPSKNFWLAVNLLPFAVLLLLLFLLVKFLHKRSLKSLTTARNKIDWKRAFFSFSLIVVITLGLFAFSYFSDPSFVEFQLDPVKFTILVIVSLLLFPLQIGLEEYLFRGYLMQQLAVVVKNRWFPLILTSVLFGVLHGGNPEVDEMGPIIMIFYIGTGLMLGIMTLMDDGLELALGFHLGNNLLAALLVTSDWSALQTDAIFRYTAEEATNQVSEILIPILVIYPIILFIFAKKYKWRNWKTNLFGRVIEPAQEDYKIIGE